MEGKGDAEERKGTRKQNSKKEKSIERDIGEDAKKRTFHGKNEIVLFANDEKHLPKTTKAKRVRVGTKFFSERIENIRVGKRGREREKRRARGRKGAL